MIEADEIIQGPSESPVALDRVINLADVFSERGALPEPELLKTFIDVLADLESAHGKGLLHRDITPERIVLDGDGWKLTDYGLAKIGTVRYMSPERSQGLPMDARSDVYSLGVTLFQAATGRLPFDAEMKFQIMDAHAATPPPLPRTINPALSLELEQVILRALAKDPSDRFQTAAEFRQALAAMVPEPERPTEPSASRTVEPAVDVTDTAMGGRRPMARPGTAAESVRSSPEGEPTHRPRRFKPAPILIPLAAVIVVVVGLLLLTGVIGGRQVPLVTGMSIDEAEQLLRRKGFRVETDTVGDTLPAGIVVAQSPEPGAESRRSRVVELTVSTGSVEVPSLAGLALSDARARLAGLALNSPKVDSQYNDDYAAGIVVSSGPKAGTRVAPHSVVGLTFSIGRATCPQCGARRAALAKFCTKCGFKF
jgi:eukaryotic-like serine/threonine-protein kinase